MVPKPVLVLPLFSLSWLNKCSGAIDDAIGITWWWCWCQWHVEWCHWWHCWHDCTLTPASMALHDQKRYVASYYDYLDWVSAVVLLMILFASHDGDADASVITWPKSHIASPFDHLYLSNWIVPLLTLFASCDTDTSIMTYDQNIILDIV